jgi:pSer/pThr/pTyr-binding forkhead associated (FHA) protein
LRVVWSLRIGHRRYVLSTGVNSVGREPGSTVCINDPSVSRGHARITIDSGVATLEDLKSKNGTQVMGETIIAPRILHDGDELEFGHVKGWFIVEESEDPPTTTHL